uniref:Leucine rich repeat containing 34 n=1 Tax=Sphaeramia orbicularis TaxID=375764 RepID=A0A673CQD4_9TELE
CNVYYFLLIVYFLFSIHCYLLGLFISCDSWLFVISFLLFCSYNSSLLSLRLSGNKIGNRGATYLAAVLQVNATLQDLHLDDCDLATQSVIALAIMLKNNRTLRSIDISRPLLFSLQEEWVVHWAEMLEVNGGLVELHLGKTGLTNTGMERLAEGLRLNHSLRYLDLRCNRVTCDGVRPLAETLKHNGTLEVIDLSSNRMEDEGAVYLSEAVASAGCGLKQLSVCSNNIRTEGLLALGQALMVNTTMSHIYIWGNPLEQAVCKAFADLMSCGRLAPEQTDVSAYEVDGHMFLAQVTHSLTRRTPGTDAELGHTNHPNTNPASTPPQNMEDEQM